MPKGKMHAGLVAASGGTHKDERREAALVRYRDAFNHGTLTKEQLMQIPLAAAAEYVRTYVPRRGRSVRKCMHCNAAILYGGYVSEASEEDGDGR
jgi:hypothetical protein